MADAHTGRRRSAVVALLCTVAMLPALPAAAVDLGVFSGPVRFEAPPGSTLDLGDRRYVGTIEARVGPDGGMTLVDELSLDAYLEGLAEVPVSWPEATLQAQVVAARTYAWYELQQGAWDDRGYGICATQACQVFAGRSVVEQDPTGRWAAAVAATSGQVLVDQDGAPLLARYSSSNGGQTQANVEIFPRDGDRPYLQSVPDPHDEVSPNHAWQVRFPRADLDAILARGETLAAAVPLADIRLVEVDGGEDLVEVTGRDGTVASVTASRFRFFVADNAPAVDADAYPPLRADGSRMPATLLSSQLSFEITDDEVVVDGRGFGHGVGMSQYGAYGKALAGFSADEILAAYYGGITPTTPDALPDQVRVGIVDGASDVTITPTAPTRVLVGDTELTARALGTWRIEVRPDRTLQVTAPEGYGAPLVVDPTTVDRPRPWAAEVVTLGTVVNKHVELEVEVRDADGELVSTTPAGIAEPGRQSVDWSLEGRDGGLLAPGSYQVQLVAIDEGGERAGSPVEITVREPAVALPVSALGPAPGTPTALSGRPLSLLPALLVGAAAGVGLGLLGSRRRRS